MFLGLLVCVALQVSEVLEQWITLQRTWMYLEPIFSNADIMQQLPLEGKRFATVDRSWRKAMDAAKHTPGVLKVRTQSLLLAGLGGLSLKTCIVPGELTLEATLHAVRAEAAAATCTLLCRCVAARSCWISLLRATSCWTACRRVWQTTWRPSASHLQGGRPSPALCDAKGTAWLAGVGRRVGRLPRTRTQHPHTFWTCCLLQVLLPVQ